MIKATRYNVRNISKAVETRSGYVWKKRRCAGREFYNPTRNFSKFPIPGQSRDTRQEAVSKQEIQVHQESSKSVLFKGWLEVSKSKPNQSPFFPLIKGKQQN